MNPRRHVSDNERRARIAVRHALAPDFRVDTPEAATRAMTVLHATESATVYLSCWARVQSVDITDIDRTLYEERTIVKQLAMRRTLFAFPRDLLSAARGKRVGPSREYRACANVERCCECRPRHRRQRLA
ncbi:DNA glycosylase AlkZ-like family protein [Rhodococcus sp. ARC_M6]|uniref:DNA glycosylase AlkZ-like family protein n=1 Tax=Rhodococcus sp. ARC_M6 TaxID=2928852 RepID=UPI001FB30197|nr:crosslink repair DNA glycosylase YcaQ family protein [Rhodococcus sp. ARC_M6]MCJ0906635.1 winged helix DNA-binding domain-containing protein [Rhodococcus sp. ARC_M6]